MAATAANPRSLLVLLCPPRRVPFGGSEAGKRRTTEESKTMICVTLIPHSNKLQRRSSSSESLQNVRIATTTMKSNNKPQLSGPCANPQCTFGGMAPSLHTCPCCHKNIHLPCGKETPDFKFVLCPICERQLEYQREAKRGRPVELKQNYGYSPPAKKYRDVYENHDGLGDPGAEAYPRCHRASETDSNSRSNTTPTPTLNDQEPSAHPWQFVAMLLTQVNQLKQELRQVKQELTDVRAENKSSYRELLRALKTNNDNLRTGHGETTTTDNNYAASDTAASVAVDAGGANNITSGGPFHMEQQQRVPALFADVGGANNIGTAEGYAIDDGTMGADENTITNAASDTSATDGGNDIEQQQEVPAAAPIGPDDVNYATLSSHPKTLHILWKEWVAGIDGRKPASQFTSKERSNKKNSTTFSRRFDFWKVVSCMVQCGMTAEKAIDKVYQVYGGPGKTVTEILKRMKVDKKHPEGRHPDLVVGIRAKRPIGPDHVDYATLSTRPISLYILWKEFVAGIDGRKPASQFTFKERSNKKNSNTFSRRLDFWKVVYCMVRRGMTAEEAIDKVYQVYGGPGKSVTAILNRMKVDKKLPGRRHPDLFVGDAAAGTTGNTT